MHQTPTSYLSATGKIRFPLTNDYMFHVVLQKNHKILQGLLSALLHLHPEDITNITIKNPITPGKSIENKEFILDIQLCINHYKLINLEMQVINEHNWAERFLCYLCRTFDQLNHGEEYQKIRPAIQIGILDFQPFSDNAEFYASYKLLNTKNFHCYSDKFLLNVLDLTHINLATDEDKAYEIDRWARLFKATTWEELKMIAAENETMSNVSQILYEYNADDYVRDQCYAREERLKKERYFQQVEEENKYLHKTVDERNNTISEQSIALQEKDTTLQKKDAALKQKDAEIARLKALLTAKK